jgi:Ni/Fe-hydrogenase subunit HybB-like protein
VNNTLHTWIKDGLWALVFAGLVAAVIRFTGGLGAATGLTDSTPWGIWIAFKLCFVALAGGGFTLAAIIYIFHLENYRPILRRAILMALLGYGSFIVSLIFDLGLPWHIYMPVINWQYHSVMFEIAWCVILYFSVLTLEFSPAILEHPWFQHPVFQKILHWLHRLTLPLVIAGIVLSTLHQSSLGSLFLIMPQRVDPLWYSPWLPYLFFTSAISAGMMALVLEGFIMERWFKRGMHFELLSQLGKWVTLPLALYLILRISDLFLRGVLPGALDGSWQSILFLAEVIIGGALPLILLAIKKVRESREGLLTSAVLIIAGIISQRMSLSMFTMFQTTGMSYFPSPSEIAIALAIPAAAILIYLFFAENLAILDKEVPTPSRNMATITDQLAFANQDNPGRTSFARRSGLATLVIALMLPFMLHLPVSLNNQPANPVIPAKGWKMLIIDGNSSGYVVRFPHQEHQERLTTELGSEEAACKTCHHLNNPEDQATACSECHTDYYQPQSIFDHTQHETALGGNASCTNCHFEGHTNPSSEICQNCHEAMVAQKGQTAFSSLAPSYLDAMHGSCLECHKQEAQKLDRPELALCSTCHPVDQEQIYNWH